MNGLNKPTSGHIIIDGRDLWAEPEKIREFRCLLYTSITPEGAYELAKCSRGTPRVANRFLKRVRDFATVLGLSLIHIYNAGQLAHGLAHQAGLQAHMAVAHLALDLSAGHHGRCV